jgi:hypothetical protein
MEQFVKLDKFLMKQFVNKLNEIVPFKLKQFLKKNTCFIAGSFVLELLHDEIYENSDIDIFCSNENEQNIFENFTKNVSDDCMIILHENPRLRYTNVKSIYTCMQFNKKIQIVIFDLPYQEMINKFEDYCDINACSSRITFNKNKFIIKNNSNKNSFVNKKYIEKLFKKNGIIYITRLYDRLYKYKQRKYIIDTSNIDEHVCGICQEQLYSPLDADYEILYGTDCNHTFHIRCIELWTSYDPGDEIIKSKSCCPLCKHVLDPIQNRDIYVYDIKLLDMENYIFIWCIMCSNVFSCEREDNTCNNEDRNYPIVCILCREQYGMGTYKRLKGTLLACPNCGIELQHNGGCSQFTCCLYGSDRCKGLNCTHGSTPNIQFCGHKWEILNN